MRLAILGGALAACVAALGCATTNPVPPLPPVAPPAVFDRVAAERDIARELDDLHDAAAHADEERYFGHFAPDAVFLGTDATERWDVPAFRAYAHPHFVTGHGWVYRPVRRAVTFGARGDVAWFDEDLLGERAGPSRGSGVLVRDHGRWLLSQYNLALTIPNERFAAVRSLLDAPSR